MRDHGLAQQEGACLESGNHIRCRILHILSGKGHSSLWQAGDIQLLPGLPISDGFIKVLKANNIRISMDGKGSFLDNIFIDRLWRSLKYEFIYIREFESVSDLRGGLTAWFSSYRSEALNYQTTDEVYQLDLAA